MVRTNLPLRLLVGVTSDMAYACSPCDDNDVVVVEELWDEMEGLEDRNGNAGIRTDKDCERRTSDCFTDCIYKNPSFFSIEHTKTSSSLEDCR